MQAGIQPANKTDSTTFRFVCFGCFVYVCVCVCARARARVRVCVYVCVRLTANSKRDEMFSLQRIFDTWLKRPVYV